MFIFGSFKAFETTVSRPLQAQTTFSDGPLPSEHEPLPLLENLEKMGKKCAAAAAAAPRPATVVPRLAAAARNGARGRGSTVCSVGAPRPVCNSRLVADR